MKNLFFSLLLLISSLLTTAQSSGNWYKVYTGKAGNLITTLHLHKAGKSYSGYVWFAQSQMPLQVLAAYPVDKTDSIMINGSSGNYAFLMTGILTATSFTGTSHVEKDGKTGKSNTFQLLVSNEKTFKYHKSYT